MPIIFSGVMNTVFKRSDGWQSTLPVKKKIYIYFASLGNFGKRDFFFNHGAIPRNTPGRQNRLREIPRCFSVNFLGVSPRKVKVVDQSFRGVARRNLKKK